MSATLDSRGGVGVSRRLSRSSTCPGALHPLDVGVRARRSRSPTPSPSCSARSTGDVLCFLPGASEIRRAIDELQRAASRRDGRGRAAARIARRGRAGSRASAVAVAAAPDRRRDQHRRDVGDGARRDGRRRLRPAQGRALRRRARRSTASRSSGSPRTPPISAPAAPARSAPGVVRRLWDARDRLRPHREPEIHRVDLSAPCSTSSPGAAIRARSSGSSVRATSAIDAALALLERLGAHRGRRADRRSAGSMQRLPLHPRLARMLVAAGGARADGAGVRAAVGASPAAAAARRRRPPICCRRIDDGERAAARAARGRARSSDRLERRRAASPSSSDPTSTAPRPDFRRAVLAGYPDRVAQRASRIAARAARVRRRRRRSRRKAASATASFSSRSTCRRRRTPERAGARAVRASPAASSANGCAPTRIEVVHRFDAATRRRARRSRSSATTRWSWPSARRRRSAKRGGAAGRAWPTRGPRDDDAQLLRRLRFAGRRGRSGDARRARRRSRRALARRRAIVASALAFDDAARARPRRAGDAPRAERPHGAARIRGRRRRCPRR